MSSAIGIDLGDRWSHYCVVNDAGEVVIEDRVRTTPEGMERLFKEMPATRVVIEAAAHSPWVSRQLESYGHQVIVANPRKVRMIYESDRKNDRVDARMLARLGRVDVSLLGPVHHRSASAQADLAVVRSRSLGPAFSWRVGQGLGYHLRLICSNVGIGLGVCNLGFLTWLGGPQRVNTQLFKGHVVVFGDGVKLLETLHYFRRNDPAAVLRQPRGLKIQRMEIRRGLAHIDVKWRFNVPKGARNRESLHVQPTFNLV